MAARKSAVRSSLAACPRAWYPLQCLLVKTVGVLPPGVGRSEECAQEFAPQSHIHSGLNQQDLVSSDVFLVHSDQYADGRWWFGFSCQGQTDGEIGRWREREREGRRKERERERVREREKRGRERERVSTVLRCYNFFSALQGVKNKHSYVSERERERDNRKSK